MNFEPKRYLAEPDAANLTGLSRRTLQRMRMEGWGIPYCRIGKRRIVYDAVIIEAYASERTFKHRAAELAQAASPRRVLVTK